MPSRRSTLRVAGALAAAALLLVVSGRSTGSWTPTGNMTGARWDHTATLLSDGTVLVAAGSTSFAGEPLAYAERYDPANGSWTLAGSMIEGRSQQTATLLPDGTVLVAGGYSSGLSSLASAELYDPVSGLWTATGSMIELRVGHTATLLLDGTVLVAGGAGGSGQPASAELYDPSSGTWTATASMVAAHDGHTATLLLDGTVLVAGGSLPLASAELYDPSSGTWTATASTIEARRGHTATLLPDGRVLVAGGGTFDPSSGSQEALSAELYDPGSGSWTATGNMDDARSRHTATLLPNGTVLVAGGAGASDPLASVELFDPGSGSWTRAGNLIRARSQQTATLLPDGRVLVAGGAERGEGGGLFSGPLPRPLASAEVYDSGGISTSRGRPSGPSGQPATPHASSLESSTPAGDTGPAWTATGSMQTARDGHTATLLLDGTVLVVGDSSYFVGPAELYDPGGGAWTTTENMVESREHQTATLLPDGRVLVAGGGTFDPGSSCSQKSLASAELYDPSDGSWTATGNMVESREYHTATLLPDGRVLVAGGATFEPCSGYQALASAELYDPSDGSWAATANMVEARRDHTATLLPDGRVLLAGGTSRTDALSSAELYDPNRGSWTTAGSMGAGRVDHTATLLPDGKVLMAGGSGSSSFVGNMMASAELYDPSRGSWAATGRMDGHRTGHTATLLPDGTVLVAGGFGGSGRLTLGELYDPISGSWAATGGMIEGRARHTATLLQDGTVLVAGGFGDGPGGPLASAELYDPVSGS